MSEKRFIIIKSIENYNAIVDKEREDIGEIILLSLHKEQQLDDIVVLLNELNDENKELKKENEQLKKRLSLYENEDEVDNYLRTHPMPTTTIVTNKRKVIPLDMRHRWY